MAKMKTDIEKNLDNKSNSKGFNKGKELSTFGPSDISTDSFKNTIGAQSDPNTSPEAHGKDYSEKVKTPREVVLNAVSWPNTSKGKRVDKGVLKVRETLDNTAAAVVNIGGTPMPQNIN